MRDLYVLEVENKALPQTYDQMSGSTEVGVLSLEL
jgi:hypothetical protein